MSVKPFLWIDPKTRASSTASSPNPKKTYLWVRTCQRVVNRARADNGVGSFSNKRIRFIDRVQMSIEGAAFHWKLLHAMLVLFVRFPEDFTADIPRLNDRNRHPQMS